MVVHNSADLRVGRVLELVRNKHKAVDQWTYDGNHGRFNLKLLVNMAVLHRIIFQILVVEVTPDMKGKFF